MVLPIHERPTPSCGPHRLRLRRAPWTLGVWVCVVVLGALSACRVPGPDTRSGAVPQTQRDFGQQAPAQELPVQDAGLQPAGPALPPPPGDPEALATYLEQGGDPNALLDGTPLLHRVIQSAMQAPPPPPAGQPPAEPGPPPAWDRILALVLDRGARLDLTDAQGRTPLALAAGLGAVDVVRALLQRGAFPDDAPGDAPRQATLAGMGGRGGIGLGDEDDTPLLRALASDADGEAKAAVVGLLLEAGASPNRRDRNGATPLHHAAARCLPLDVIRTLHRHGALVNGGDVNFFTPLHRASQAGCLETRAYLLSAGGRELSQPYPVGDNAPAVQAVLQHDPRLLATLPPSAFMALSGRNVLGQVVTPLHLAVERGRSETLAVLAQRGMNWSVRDPYGRTPLHLAVLMEDASRVGLLLAHGADPLVSDLAGETPLSLAAGRTPVLTEMLLTRITSPPGGEGFPVPHALALRNAVLVGHDTVVRRLVPGGNAGLFPLAVVSGHPALAAYLAPDTDSERVQRALAQSAVNHAAMENYTARPGPRPPRLMQGWNIWGKTGLLRYPLEMWAPSIDQPPDRNLAKYPVGLYVPRAYRGASGYGLMVSLHGGRAGEDFPPPAYREVLDRGRMVWVGYSAHNGLLARRPSSTGGAPGLSEQEAFALSVVHNLRQYYDLDPRRIYLAGSGAGAPLAVELLARQPKVFRGALAMNGRCQAWPSEAGNPESALGEGAVTEAWFPARRLALASTTLVLTSGDLDPGRGAVFRSYQRCLAEGYRRVFLVQEPGGVAGPPSPAVFHQALRLLDP